MEVATVRIGGAKEGIEEADDGGWIGRFGTGDAKDREGNPEACDAFDDW